MGAKPVVEIDYNAATNDAADMPFRQLERRCARTAAKAGKFLASARAILEADLPYFLELRQRLNAQGQRRFDIEGWTRWCEKHFSCSVRTVNRALSSLLGPEKERKKSRKWRAPAEALIAATEPALRLARRHKNDPDASEFLSLLEEEALEGLITEPPVRSPSYLDNLDKERRIKKEELFKMGLHLAEAVVEAPGAVRGETPEGKKILGLAKHMLEIKKTAGELTVYQSGPQDKLSRTPGTNLVVDDDDLTPTLKAHNYYLVHVGMEDGEPIIAKYLGLQGRKHQFERRAVGVYNVGDIGKVIRPANEKEIAEELAWEDLNEKDVKSARENESKARKASGSM